MVPVLREILQGADMRTGAENLLAFFAENGLTGARFQLFGFEDGHPQMCKVCTVKGTLDFNDDFTNGAFSIGVEPFLERLWMPTVKMLPKDEKGEQPVMLNRPIHPLLGRLTSGEMVDLAVFLLRAGAKYLSFCFEEDGSRTLPRVGSTVDVAMISQRDGAHQTGIFQLGGALGLDHERISMEV